MEPFGAIAAFRGYGGRWNEAHATKFSSLQARTSKFLQCSLRQFTGRSSGLARNSENLCPFSPETPTGQQSEEVN